MPLVKYGGVLMKMRSSASSPSVSATLPALLETARSVWQTPLGRPVVPDVNMIIAMLVLARRPRVRPPATAATAVVVRRPHAVHEAVRVRGDDEPHRTALRRSGRPRRPAARSRPAATCRPASPRRAAAGWCSAARRPGRPATRPACRRRTGRTPRAPARRGRRGGRRRPAGPPRPASPAPPCPRTCRRGRACAAASRPARSAAQRRRRATASVISGAGVMTASALGSEADVAELGELAAHEHGDGDRQEQQEPEEGLQAQPEPVVEPLTAGLGRLRALRALRRPRSLRSPQASPAFLRAT